MATAKSCGELQLIGISNNTFKVQADSGSVITFCGESGKDLFNQHICAFRYNEFLFF